MLNDLIKWHLELESEFQHSLERKLKGQTVSKTSVPSLLPTLKMFNDNNLSLHDNLPIYLKAKIRAKLLGKSGPNTTTVRATYVFKKS